MKVYQKKPPRPQIPTDGLPFPRPAHSRSFGRSSVFHTTIRQPSISPQPATSDSPAPVCSKPAQVCVQSLPKKREKDTGYQRRPYIRPPHASSSPCARNTNSSIRSWLQSHRIIKTPRTDRPPPPTPSRAPHLSPSTTPPPPQPLLPPPTRPALPRPNTANPSS